MQKTFPMEKLTEGYGAIGNGANGELAEMDYCTCLENRSGLKTTGGSNPSLTAIFPKKKI